MNELRRGIWYKLLVVAMLLSIVLSTVSPVSALCGVGDDILTQLRGTLSARAQISGDGTSIVFTGDDAVQVYDLDTCQVELISQTPEGVNGDHASYRGVISADGNMVTFVSDAADLVENDPPLTRDLFVRNRALGTTVRIVRPSGGTLHGLDMYDFAMSDDGRYVVFTTYEPLDPRDSGTTNDVYRYDTQTGSIVLVNVTAGGQIGNGGSNFPSISADGRYIAFASYATNLVMPDANGTKQDVYVHDMLLGTNERVSVNNGQQAPANALYFVDATAISGDGSVVAFVSDAPGLAPGDTGISRDLFVFDRATDTLSRITNGTSQSYVYSADFSYDGRYVAFDSNQPGLVPVDGGAIDAYVHDRQTGKTRRISVNTSLVPGNLDSGGSTISFDGQYVAFHSRAWNLVDSPDSSNPGKLFLSNWMLLPVSSAHFHLDFQGRPARPAPAWAIPARVRLTFTEDFRSYTETIYGVTDAYGTLTIENIPPGTYPVWLKGFNTLSRYGGTITTAAGDLTQDFGGFGTLLAGDANDDDRITIIDFSILAGSFGRSANQLGYDPRADFDGDASITLTDFSLMVSNFGLQGDG